MDKPGITLQYVGPLTEASEAIQWYPLTYFTGY